MALYGRFLYGYEILTSFVAPVIMEGIYLYRYNDEIHLMWKIMVFPMMAVYLTLDKAIWDNFSKFSKESYWLHLLRSPPPESHAKDDQNEKKDTTTSSEDSDSTATIDWNSSSRAIRIDDILEEPSDFLPA